MESTYGDRTHLNWQERGKIIAQAKSSKGNILIPVFTVGRTQELIYEFQHHFKA
jgi:metallo-beta-lactamase family protein